MSFIWNYFQPQNSPKSWTEINDNPDVEICELEDSFISIFKININESNESYKSNEIIHHLKIKNNLNILIDKNLGFFQVFNLKYFLQDIWLSFHGSIFKLVKQLEVDFPRQAIFVNDIECKNIKEYLEFLSFVARLPRGLVTKDEDAQCANLEQKWISKYTSPTNHNGSGIDLNILYESLDILFMLLTNQSAYYHQFSYLMKMYVNVGENKHLIHSNSRPIINIYCGNKYLVKIDIGFKLINADTVDTGTVVDSEIKSSVMIDLNQLNALLSWMVVKKEPTVP